MKKKFLKLLKWSQKYTKTDMVYLASGGFWLTFTKIAGVIASLLSSIVFANLLSQHDYGVYQYVLAIVSLLTLSTLPGVDTALIRTVAKGNEGTFLDSFKEKVKWGFLGTIASFAISAYYFFNNNEVLGIAFLMVGFFIPFMDSLNVWIAFLSGKKDFKEQTKLQALTRTGSTIVLVLTVLITRDPLIILFMYFVSYTTFRFLIFNSILKKIDINSPKDSESNKYGIHLTIQSIPTIFSKTIDSILVFQLLGGPALAGYGLSKLPMKHMQNIFSSVNTLALPKLSDKNLESIKLTLPKKILLLYILIIPAILLYWFLAPIFFKILYPQYLEFVFYSQLFSLQLIWLPANLFHTSLVAHGAKRKLYIFEITSAVVRITTVALLLYLFGIIGAILGYLLTGFIVSIILALLFFNHK